MREQCVGQRSRGRRCRRKTMDPNGLCWRVVALFRSVEPLVRLCDQHAEQAIRTSVESVVKYDPVNVGRRRQLVENLKAAPPGEWVPSETLAAAIYGEVGPTEVSAVRMLVWRIRQIDKTLIETLQGVGYRLRAQQMTGPTEEQHARAS